MNIEIRLETPADYQAVEEISREAFWQFWEENRTICDEHLLVHKLRDVKTYVPELDYIAEVDGKLVGHIIYTRSWIETDDGRKIETLTFGPLAVLPEYQSKGIGRALMQHSFAEAKRLGYSAVVIYGIPDYYPRVGFRRASEFGLTDAAGNTYDALLIYPLCDDALDGIQGKHRYDPVYEQLTQEEAIEFDKRFPPKSLHKPVPLDVISARLKPEALKAIQDFGVTTFDMIKSHSEREISSLPGMDAESLEIIRATMHEHKYPWGERK